MVAYLKLGLNLTDLLPDPYYIYPLFLSGSNCGFWGLINVFIYSCSWVNIYWMAAICKVLCWVTEKKEKRIREYRVFALVFTPRKGRSGVSVCSLSDSNCVQVLKQLRGWQFRIRHNLTQWDQLQQGTNYLRWKGNNNGGLSQPWGRCKQSCRDPKMVSEVTASQTVCCNPGGRREPWAAWHTQVLTS